MRAMCQSFLTSMPQHGKHSTFLRSLGRIQMKHPKRLPLLPMSHKKGRHRLYLTLHIVHLIKRSATLSWSAIKGDTLSKIGDSHHHGRRELCTYDNESEERLVQPQAAPAAMPPATVLTQHVNNVVANGSEVAVVRDST